MMSRMNWLFKMRNLFDKLKRLSKNQEVKKQEFINRFRGTLQFLDLVDSKFYKDKATEMGLSVFEIENKILKIDQNYLTEDLLMNAIMIDEKPNDISKKKKVETETLGSTKKLTTESKKLSTFFYEEDDDDDECVDDTNPQQNHQNLSESGIGGIGELGIPGDYEYDPSKLGGSSSRRSPNSKEISSERKRYHIIENKKNNTLGSDKLGQEI